MISNQHLNYIPKSQAELAFCWHRRAYETRDIKYLPESIGSCWQGGLYVSNNLCILIQFGPKACTIASNHQFLLSHPLFCVLKCFQAQHDSMMWIYEATTWRVGGKNRQSTSISRNNNNDKSAFLRPYKQKLASERKFMVQTNAGAILINSLTQQMDSRGTQIVAGREETEVGRASKCCWRSEN